ncbi:MAG TPA: hypothetical protein DEB31_09400 [Clostridiales bacterium]|nr:hypothetical protein [Clostridiales bacterium]
MRDSELVRNAYRLILGREPENETCLSLEFNDVYSLRKHFMQSEEFQSLLSDNTYMNHYYSITTFEEYDEFIELCKQYEKDQEALLKVCAEYILDPQPFFKLFGSMPYEGDPFSREYADWEFAFFEFLSGQKYFSGNEGAGMETEELSATLFYPCQSQIRSFERCAKFLKAIRPNAGDRVFEMGFGWGALLEALGRCGCRVAGLDVSKTLCEYVKRRLGDQNIEANLINGSFFAIEQVEGTFDCIIFESSFHHCADPVRLMNIVSKKLAVGGRLIFLDEPVYPVLDRPWGVTRYDGQALMAVRMQGWLEYGFRADFFEQMLQRAGLKLQAAHQQAVGTPVYEAVKILDQ